MPTFPTPTPLSVTAHIDAGSIRFTAGDRTDTTVDIQPRDPERDRDVKEVKRVDVSCVNGVLTIRTPKSGNSLRRPGTVDITVCLPTGSSVDLTGAWAQVLGEGRLGETRMKVSAGDVRLDGTGPLELHASHGSITVERVEGRAEITTSTGSLRVGAVEGPAVLKNSHGTTFVGAVTGDLRVSAGHGDIDIARAESSVAATTAYGTIRAAEVACGAVQLETSYGAIDVGVREGSAVWLDVSCGSGQVRNSLSATTPPESAERTVEVRVRTRYGNIDIRRARA